MPDPAPGFGGILETVLYHERRGEARDRAFLLRGPRSSSGDALRRRGRLPEWGSGILLLFDTEKLAQRAEPHMRHGAQGPGHACLVTSSGEYEEWKRRLIANSVSIDHEVSWPGGARSIYFRDPADNLLEIADGDLWPK